MTGIRGVCATVVCWATQCAAASLCAYRLADCWVLGSLGASPGLLTGCCVPPSHPFVRSCPLLGLRRVSGMPPKKPNIGRSTSSRPGKKTSDRKRSREDEDLRAAYVRLEAQLDATTQQHRENIAEITELNKRLWAGSVAVLGGLTGRHRRRSSIGGDDDVGAEQPQLETLGQRLMRLDAEIANVSNSRGRSRTYWENHAFVFSCLKVERDVVPSMHHAVAAARAPHASPLTPDPAASHLPPSSIPRPAPQHLRCSICRPRAALVCRRVPSARVPST
eukprot:COSAG02_NODE_5696_length_4115_cov_5.925548_1_plen_277_part_00